MADCNHEIHEALFVFRGHRIRGLVCMTCGERSLHIGDVATIPVGEILDFLAHVEGHDEWVLREACGCCYDIVVLQQKDLVLYEDIHGVCELEGLHWHLATPYYLCPACRQADHDAAHCKGRILETP